MSTIQELRAKAQADGQELVKQFQELDVQKNEILAKQRQIIKTVVPQMLKKKPKSDKLPYKDFLKLHLHKWRNLSTFNN